MTTNQQTTYEVETSRIRDVDTVIRNIDPTDTPFMSTIGDESTKSKLIEWIEDTYEAPSSTEAQVEGFDFPEARQTEVTYRTNLVQTFASTARVTGFVEEQKLYGRASEFARQKAKAATELKRTVEKQLVGIAPRAAVVGSTSIARKFANAGQLMDSSHVDDNGGTPRALDEDIVLAAMNLLYDAGVDFSKLMVKPSDTLKIADFAYATGRQRDNGSDKKVVNSVEVYEGPFGDVKVQKNRWLLSSHAWLYDPEMWSKVWFRKWKMKPIPSTGDWMAESIYGDLTLKHKNFKGSVLVTDLN